MLARLAGALGMALVPLSAGATAKNVDNGIVDNGIVERTQSYRIGDGYNADGHASGVRLARDDDRCDGRDCDQKRHKHRSHHGHDD